MVGRESHQMPVVKMMIGKMDKLFISASVMPQQGFVFDADHRCLVQDAFQVDGEIIFLIFQSVHFIIGVFKESGRRQLFVVPHNHHLFGPHDGADGVFREDLGGFVENHQIELNFG